MTNHAEGLGAQKVLRSRTAAKRTAPPRVLCPSRASQQLWRWLDAYTAQVEETVEVDRPGATTITRRRPLDGYMAPRRCGLVEPLCGAITRGGQLSLWFVVLDGRHLLLGCLATDPPTELHQEAFDKLGHVLDATTMSFWDLRVAQHHPRNAACAGLLP